MSGKTKAQLEREYAQLAREFDKFKETVRSRIVSAIEDNEICRSGGTEALIDFGLEPPKTAFEGSLCVTVSFSDYNALHDQYGYGELDDDAARSLIDTVSSIFTDAAEKHNSSDTTTFALSVQDVDVNYASEQ